MASLETRVTKLEQRNPNRRALAVLICEDGKEEQAAADYLAGLPPEKHPEHVVVIRTFCRPQATEVLKEIDAG